MVFLGWFFFFFLQILELYFVFKRLLDFPGGEWGGSNILEVLVEQLEQNSEENKLFFLYFFFAFKPRKVFHALESYRDEDKEFYTF